MNKVNLIIKSEMNMIIILFIVLLSGCASNTLVKVEDIDVQMPKIWQTSIPSSEKVTGKWWEIFNDDDLESFILDFQQNSPDLQSIIDNKNIQKFDEGIFFVQKQNALNYLKSCGEYDIIFADPPYGCNELPELVKLGLEHIKDFGTFILESRTGDELPESTDNRTYGDTQLNLWKK